jgi:dTDP-glucose 4,6-dehydratase
MIGVMENSYKDPINLGNPAEITINEFAEQIIKVSGVKVDKVNLPLPKDDPKRRKPDITKAKKIIGWEPKVSLEEGLKKTIEWAKENV